MDTVTVDGSPVTLTDGKYTFSNVTTDHAINATFKAIPPKTYTVFFNKNGGNKLSVTKKTVTKGQAYGILPTPTKKGHTFKGWYTDKSGGSKITSTSTVNIKTDQTLYAMWKANKYNVIFMGNKGKIKKSGKYKATAEDARGIFSILIIIALVISVIIAAAGLIFLKQILYFIGANDALMPLCIDYAIPTFLMMPLSVFGMIFQMSFITVGKAHYSLIASVVGGITNIILDYVFIALLGMGIGGATIATGIGYSIPALFGLLYFIFNRNGNLYVVRPVFNLKALVKSCTNGASEMVTSLSTSVVILLLNNILMRMIGPDGVASITIIMYAQGLLSSVFMGYSFGISPIISYNFGKSNHDRLKSIYSISLRSIFAVSIAMMASSLLLSNTLVGIFIAGGTAVFDMAVRGFRMFSIAFLFTGFNVYSSAMFTALNNGKISAILSFFRTLVFIIFAALTLPIILGIDGVWLAIPAAEVLSILMTVYYFKKMKPVYRYA